MSHECFALLAIDAANKVGEISLFTVLKNDDKKLLLFMKEKLASFDDVRMFNTDVEFCFSRMEILLFWSTLMILSANLAFWDFKQAKQCQRNLFRANQ